MSYSQNITISDGRRLGRPILLWLFGAAIVVCMLAAVGHALFPGMYSWITRTGQYADIATIKIANTGFEPRSVTLSTNQHLHIVNASSLPVAICPGSEQICYQYASSNTIPAEGLTIQPGKTYDLSLKDGNYSFTIMPQVGSAFDVTNLNVAVQDNSAVDSSNDYSGIDSGGDSGGSSISSGVSSSSDEEENSTSSGSSVSSGVSSSSDDEEENSTSSGSSVSSGTSSSSDEEENSTSSSSTSSGADDSSSAGGDDGGDE
jgi:hypothetical protein